MVWKKNGTPDTLIVAGDTLEIIDLTAAQTNQFMSNVIVDSGLVSCAFTYNNNTNSVYASRNSANGGTDATAVNQTSSISTSATLDTADEQGFNIMYTVSVSGEEKLSMFWNMDTDSGTGAGNAPQRREAVFKFVPSPDADIISVECDNSQAGDYAIDTNLSALADVVAAPAAVGGWVEIGRTTLGVAGDTISVSSLADKRYYKILYDITGSGTFDSNFRLNADSGSNYAARISQNGGTDATETSATDIRGLTSSSRPQFGVYYISNLASNEKLLQGHTVDRESTGAASAPTRLEGVGKWVNTSDPIDEIALFNTNSGDFDTGSQVVVLGWDPSDTHTDNFWEELANVQPTSATSLTLSSGTITAKKYLWVQYYSDQNSNAVLRFNGDSANNYARRGSLNGAADFTVTNTSGDFPTPGADAAFVNFFVINNATDEKLVTGSSVGNNAAGAANATTRKEFTVKWVNTSDQITEITFTKTGADYTANSFIKVWGSD